MDVVETLHMLMVDDDVDLLDATSRGLSRRGFKVTVTDDGARALELMRVSSFDVLVVDVRMPGLDGVELFRQAKQLSPSLPVIMLTGHGSIKQAYEFSREGVFEYLTKPCDVDKLAKVARRAYEAGRANAAKDHVRVVIVDDDVSTVEPLVSELEQRGFIVAHCASSAAGAELVAQQPIDVAVVALSLTPGNTRDLVLQLKKARPSLEIVLLSEQPSMRQAIDGMSAGAFDMGVKPVRLDVLVMQLRRAATSAREKAANPSDAG